MSCFVLEDLSIVCLSGTSKAYTVAQVLDDGSEASDSSGLPLSEMLTPRGTFF
jgi:hypothetical protein